MIKYTFIFALLFVTYQTQATNYYSTQDGNWSDPIWSTVSHSETGSLVALPCAFVGNDIAHIAHEVTSLCAVLDVGHLGGNCRIELTPTGSFTTGTINLYGGFLVVINPGTAVTINGNLNMFGNSEITVDGTLLVNGDVDMTGNSLVCGSGTASYTGTLTTDGNSKWCDLLPIELVKFEGSATSNGIDLEWATASEMDNSHFVVERSYYGEIFEQLSQIKGAGNSNRLIKYSYTDNQLSTDSEWAYYRIKQVDFSGNFSYSPLIAVSLQSLKGAQYLKAYPNPAQNYFNLELATFSNDFTILVYNSFGLQVSEMQYSNAKQVTLDCSDWNAGNYILVVQTEKLKLQKRITVLQ